MAIIPYRPTAEEIAAAAGKKVPDVIAPDLAVLFCGINPGLYSGAVGHHFARPGNRFWPALYASGFTDHRLSPFEDSQLPEYGCGITNLVARATAGADELTAEELAHGGRLLRRKLSRSRPAFVAFLGIGAYRTAFDRPRAGIGRQAESLAGVAVWVLPNPSGLNAHYRLADLTQQFALLRAALPRLV